MAKMQKFNSVESYFDAQTEEVRSALEVVKKCILKAAPDSTEVFNYNIPAYTLIENGKRDQQIMIAGYAKHIGFYPHPTTIAHFENELSSYKKGKGSVQFPLNEPMPCELIERMVQYRLSMLTE